MPHRSFPEADIGNGTQHFGGADDRNAGQSGLVHVQPMLTQKTFAYAAEHIRQGSGFHQTGHAIVSEPAESKQSIRRARVQQSSLGTKTLCLAVNQMPVYRKQSLASSVTRGQFGLCG